MRQRRALTLAKQWRGVAKLHPYQRAAAALLRAMSTGALYWPRRAGKTALMSAAYGETRTVTGRTIAPHNPPRVLCLPPPKSGPRGLCFDESTPIKEPKT
jgi:hypothetical protein